MNTYVENNLEPTPLTISVGVDGKPTDNSPLFEPENGASPKKKNKLKKLESIEIGNLVNVHDIIWCNISILIERFEF
jgi:hypothetical protein